MAMTDFEKKVKKVKKKTVERMEQIGTYRMEFDVPIQRYAEMQVQYQILNQRWIDEGCVITEEYTNKAGATNPRKSALYLSIESLRKELIDLENLFGLTPRGLKMIKSKGLEKTKQSKLAEVLGNYET